LATRSRAQLTTPIQERFAVCVKGDYDYDYDYDYGYDYGYDYTTTGDFCHRRMSVSIVDLKHPADVM
jgi:hypothetical protein